MGGALAAISVRLKQSDLWLVAGMFGTVLLLVLPVPPFLLDLMLTVSIALSLLILLVILYVREPAEFSGFPSLLLFVTLGGFTKSSTIWHRTRRSAEVV